jgi:crotonobetainyl-CoA:carnitine CoA-transferase CaiB-like acyl-CoA transferase
VVFCNKDKFWQELVEALEAPELATDPRFGTFPDRHAHRDTLLPLLRARFGTRTTAEWLDRLRGRVPCAPVNDVRQALADEQVRARDMIVEVEHPEFGTLKEVRSPIRTAGEVRNPRRAPRLGEDTDAILRDILSYGPATIAGLRQRGVIG